MYCEYQSDDPAVGGLLGQAVGDAFGVPVEFLGRAEVRKINLQDMVGCDTGLSFHSRWGDLIPHGAWSDDTSMTVAAMASIVEHHGNIDYDDVMRAFLRWWENGEYSSLKFPFGLGGNISQAMARYKRGVSALSCGGTGFMENGNGALMRMFPFSMYCIYKGLGSEETLDVIRKAASLTHAHEINILCCLIDTRFLAGCIRTKNPREALRFSVREFDYAKHFSPDGLRAVSEILDGSFPDGFDPEKIPESGYVADSLKIALYSILKTASYEDAIKMAVNFGYDTDTNAAITGSIAGAMYGMNAIPERWLAPLRKREELIRLARTFSKCISTG